MRRFGHDRRCPLGHETGVSAPDETSAGMRFRELDRIFATGTKGEMGSRCLMQGTQIVDLSFPVGAIIEFGADRFRYRLQGIGASALEKARVLHVVSEVGAIRGSTQRRKGKFVAASPCGRRAARRPEISGKRRRARLAVGLSPRLLLSVPVPILWAPVRHRASSIWRGLAPVKVAS
jgi:hypothetical protein